MLRLDRTTRQQLNGVSKTVWLKAKKDTKASALRSFDSVYKIEERRTVGVYECSECGGYKEPRVRCSCGAW